MQQDPSANEAHFSRDETFLDLVDVIRRWVAVIVDKSDNRSRCGAPSEITRPSGAWTRLSQNSHGDRARTPENIEHLHRTVARGIVDEDYLPLQHRSNPTQRFERRGEEFRPIVRRYYNGKIHH